MVLAAVDRKRRTWKWINSLRRRSIGELKEIKLLVSVDVWVVGIILDKLFSLVVLMDHCVNKDVLEDGKGRDNNGRSTTRSNKKL